MLTSKDILERTGISRATLNNYIASGLVAKPDVLPPGPEDGGAPRIGYFPDDTVERIATIQRLKQQGWSISRIASHLSQPAAGSAAPPQRVAAVTVLPAAVAPAPAGRRTPALTPLAVLVATLNDSAGLWRRLPPQEYFELVSEVWAALEPIVRLHRGVLGRHADEGVVAFFLPSAAASYAWNAVSAAHALREAMRPLSDAWRAGKGWDVELQMDIGIDEGEDWLGTTPTGELRVLGEAAERAECFSRCSRPGGVLVSRRLLAKLAAAERSRITYGVPRTAVEGGELLQADVFARLAEAARPECVPPRFADIPVAQIAHVQTASADPGTVPTGPGEEP